MPLADKAILRLAIYEMLFVEDVPLSVSIDEAVELAKDFGAADKSPAFVNGVLGRIAALLAAAPDGLDGLTALDLLTAEARAVDEDAVNEAADGLAVAASDAANSAGSEEVTPDE